MIVVQVTGGLGNQLFQYAAGRTLALLKNTSLALDLSGFENYHLRRFDLDALEVSYQIATPDETRVYYQRSLAGKLRDRLLPMAWRKVYREPHFQFHNRIFRCNAGVYLKGYWQSELYFVSQADTIRREFRFKPELISGVTEIAAQIRSTEAVAVHIRRGDYGDPETNRIHGILPFGYYEQAMQLIRERHPQSLFYFFTDDAQWLQQQTLPPASVIVSGTYSRTHFEDLYLMSICKHNIIANSSFSWWGGWLNDHAGKTVIAPEQWFQDKSRNTRDIIPAGWIRL